MGYAVEGIRELLSAASVPIHVHRAEAEFVRKTTDVPDATWWSTTAT